MRSAVGAIMAAVFVAILSNKAPAKIVAYVPPAAINAGLPQSSLAELFEAIGAGTPAALAQVSGMTPQIEAAVASSLSNAYVAAYAYVYYAAVAVACVGLVACICVKDYDDFFTSHIPRQIYTSGEKENLQREDANPTNSDAEVHELEKSGARDEFIEVV
jgi:hypothetical protein